METYYAEHDDKYPNLHRFGLRTKRRGFSSDEEAVAYFLKEAGGSLMVVYKERTADDMEIVYERA